MIDRPTIERILDAAQIVMLVQEFVPLKKRGATSLAYALSTMKKTILYCIPVKRDIQMFPDAER